MNGLRPFTAGAFGVILIVTEAREVKNVVDKSRARNPCQKAKRLRTIKEEAGSIPQTDALSHQHDDKKKKQLCEEHTTYVLAVVVVSILTNLRV